MGALESHDVTQLLQAAADGDSRAAAELLPLVYEELRNLARVRMAKTPPGNTLQPTALVHEAFLRLVGEGDPGWQNRGHFFGAAAQAMRQILVDQARRKASLKRGGDVVRVDVAQAEPVIEEPDLDLVALDVALHRLNELDPRKVQIVNLRYFAGLTEEETADALCVSVGAIKHEWRFIRRWLYRELSR